MYNDPRATHPFVTCIYVNVRALFAYVEHQEKPPRAIAKYTSDSFSSLFLGSGLVVVVEKAGVVLVPRLFVPDGLF